MVWMGVRNLESSGSDCPSFGHSDVCFLPLRVSFSLLWPGAIDASAFIEAHISAIELIGLTAMFLTKR
jgi:hypothetical protein